MFQLSWGDVYFVAVSDYLIKMVGFDYFEKYENLKRLQQNVISLPKIQKWIETRSKSDF